MTPSSPPSDHRPDGGSGRINADPTSSPPAPFFIVGADRSGTSLLRVILNRHPAVWVCSESHFIPPLWARRRRYGSGGRVERRDVFLEDLASEHRFRLLDLKVENIRGRLAARVLTLGEAIGLVLLMSAQAQGKAAWGDKTPRYVRHIPLLARLFPDARFVHIIRDGRDVALSTLDLKHLHSHAATAAFFWKRAAMAGRRAGQALAAGRYLEVRYENLVNDPEAESKRVLEFLGLPYDPAVLRQDESRVPLRPPGKWSENRRPWLAHRPPTKGLRDWRRDMSPREVAEFEAVAGAALTALGYERVTTRPVLGSWLPAWLRVAWFPARTLRPRLRSSFRAYGRRVRSRRLQRAARPARGVL